MYGMDEENDLEFLSKEELVAKCEELLLSNRKLQLEVENIKLANPASKKKTKGDRKGPNQRPIDFKRYNKQHMAFKFLYLGWDYRGYASQDNTVSTIEEEIFSAFTKAKLIEDRLTSNYSRCGRTDKGVSAFGQVIALDVRSTLKKDHEITSEGKEKIGKTHSNAITTDQLPYVKILNRLLPQEIRILAYCHVDPDFDARFNCKARKYKYFFPAEGLDIELMHEASQKFVGENDYRNFCKVDVGNNIYHFTRNVVSFAIKRIENSPMCEMEINGMAFLWHQVRRMASVLFLIGLHHEKPEVIDYMLDIKKCPKCPQYGMASEIPLVLFDCTYDHLDWVYEEETNEYNIIDLQQLWTHKSVQSTMLDSMIRDLKQRTPPSNITTATRMTALLPGYRETEHIPLNQRAVCDGLERQMLRQGSKRIKLEQRYLERMAKRHEEMMEDC